MSTPVLPVDADHELGACAKSGLDHEPDVRECVMDRPPAPVDSQKTLPFAGVKRAADSQTAGKNVMKPLTFDGKEPVNSFRLISKCVPTLMVGQRKKKYTGFSGR